MKGKEWGSLVYKVGTGQRFCLVLGSSGKLVFFPFMTDFSMLTRDQIIR